MRGEEETRRRHGWRDNARIRDSSRSFVPRFARFSKGWFLTRKRTTLGLIERNAVTIVSHCSLRFSPMANRLFPSPDPTADQGIPIANLLPGFAIGERSLFCIPAKGIRTAEDRSFRSFHARWWWKRERERERVRVRKCPFSRFGNLYL